MRDAVTLMQRLQDGAVVEQVDTPDLKSCGRKVVRVQIPLALPIKKGNCKYEK